MSKIKIAPLKLIFNIIAFVFLVYSAITVCSQSMQIRAAKKMEVQVNEQLKHEKQRAQELDEETSKIGTDEFIEKKAKEKLGYVKSNEKIFYDKAQ
ncbi:MAG: septum formation initiator family protein [Bacillota bacterium]|nr:septum formation initiator family protein [Bacillota bacterium]